MLDGIIGGLKDWTRVITAVIFMSLALELVVPEGNTRKYVKLVTGLLILFAVLNPLLSLSKYVGEVQPIAFPTDVGESGKPLRDVLALGERLNSVGRTVALQEYKGRLEELIRKDVVTMPGVRSCTAEVVIPTEGSQGHPWIRVTVKFIPEVYEKADWRTKTAVIRDMIHDRYGIDPGSIEVKVVR